MEIILVSR